MNVFINNLYEKYHDMSDSQLQNAYKKVVNELYAIKREIENISEDYSIPEEEYIFELEGLNHDIMLIQMEKNALEKLMESFDIPYKKISLFTRSSLPSHLRHNKKIRPRRWR